MRALHELMTIAARIGEEGALSQAFRAKLAAAIQTADLDPRGAAALREAYAAVSGGRAFALPQEPTFDAVLAYGRASVGRAAKAIEGRRHEEAARELTAAILSVVTPVPQPHKK
jgi:hypothetical protein